MKKDWPARWLRDKLDYVAGDIGLFEAALTHRSASGRNSERLEFLGDAVLNLLVAEQLYRRFGDASEGEGPCGSPRGAERGRWGSVMASTRGHTCCVHPQGPFSCLNSARFGIAFGALGAAGTSMR